MMNETLLQEINALPQEMIRQVEEYVRFLRFTQKNPEAGNQKLAKRKGGTLAGGLVFMADDFDETPDCFKEYL